jgi:hypothetical protein
LNLILERGRTQCRANERREHGRIEARCRTRTACC